MPPSTRLFRVTGSTFSYNVQPDNLREISASDLRIIAGVDQRMVPTSSFVDRTFLYASSSDANDGTVSLFAWLPGYAKTKSVVKLAPFGIPLKEHFVSLVGDKEDVAFGTLRVRAHGLEQGTDTIRSNDCRLGVMQLTSRLSGSSDVYASVLSPDRSGEDVMHGIPQGAFEVRFVSASEDVLIPPRSQPALKIEIGPQEAIVDLDLSSYGSLRVWVEVDSRSEYEGPIELHLSSRQSAERTATVVMFRSAPYILEILRPGDYDVSVVFPPDRIRAGRLITQSATVGVGPHRLTECRFQVP